MPKLPNSQNGSERLSSRFFLGRRKCTMMTRFSATSVVPSKERYALLPKPAIEVRRLEKYRRHGATLNVAILDSETTPGFFDPGAHAVSPVPPLADGNTAVESPRQATL